MTAVLFGVSGFFVGPFAAALFVARNRLAPGSVRTQVFTIGAGLKVTAAALGAALVGFAAQLPVSGQLLLVASSPLVAGFLAVLLLHTPPQNAGHERQGETPRAAGQEARRRRTRASEA